MIRDHRFIRLLPLAFCLVYPLTAQTIFDPIEITSDNYTNVIAARAAYIRINPTYPVVPGDVYTLAYTRDTAIQKTSFYIESDYTINFAHFGRLNVEGYSYGRLKQEIEALIEKNYPGSLPQLSISSPGFFMVYVKGDAVATVDIPAWGFMKLSATLKDLTTPYSSNRRIEIQNGKGESRFYDLFRSRQMGEREQDPYLQKGDTIILHRYDRKITVEGEVYNPGTFELLPGEGLTTLIEEYARGMTPMADRNRVELTRYLSPSAKFGETLYLDFSGESLPADFPLADMDTIKNSEETGSPTPGLLSGRRWYRSQWNEDI